MKKCLIAILILFFIPGIAFSAQQTLNNGSLFSVQRAKINENFTDLYTNKEGALTDSAGLAAALDDETGTLLVVFSTSPTITTPTFVTSITMGSAGLTEPELEILDGATLDTTELNYVDGVTSAIQTQLDSKAAHTPTTSVTFTIGGDAGDDFLITNGTELMKVEGDTSLITFDTTIDLNGNDFTSVSDVGASSMTPATELQINIGTDSGDDFILDNGVALLLVEGDKSLMTFNSAITHSSGLFNHSPETIAFTTEANLTIAETVVLLDGDNDTESDVLDLQDGTTAGQVLYLVAAADIDADDTCTISFADTTCTGCAATVFNAIGENAHFIWSGTTWIQISLQDSL